GVINDEGDIDLIGGTSISIVPDDAADTITINSTLVVPAETDPIWRAAEPNYANLGQNEIITGNWDNTANPWADNEVADNLTINGGTINNTPIGAGIPFTGAFTTLSSNNGLTVTAGGASITGGLNNNLGGITNAGNITGATQIVVDTMTIDGGSITDTTGAISFGDENLTTTGNITGNQILFDNSILNAEEWSTSANDIVLDPAGGNVLPGSDSADSLGAIGIEWLNLYVDNVVAGGMTMSGDLDMSSNLILNIGNINTDFTVSG
ncbi:unnamed protein product, partial [marine sediment metagenome]